MSAIAAISQQNIISAVVKKGGHADGLSLTDDSFVCDALTGGGGS